MGRDLLNIQANQRVDIGDFKYAIDEAVQGNVREAVAQFFTDPAGQRFWVLSGFEQDNPDGAPLGGTQFRVTRGRGIFSQREGSLVNHGVLLTQGDTTKIVEMSSFADAVYGAYLRFEYVEGNTESRIFWDASGTGSEIAQSVPTRRLANWSLRLETSSPGSEWSKIAEVTLAGGVITAITDMRPMFFEGVVSDTYASGWSSDGGGSVNDRDADRQQYGVTDIQTFTAAMRQSLEDLKGRGLRRWWDRDIGGMNVGFDADPIEGTFAVGDANFHMEIASGRPYLYFDASDYLFYDRTTNIHKFAIGGISRGEVSTSGFYTAYGVRAGASSTPNGGDGIFSRGLVVGYDGVPANDAVSVGDANFRMQFGADPSVYFDASSYLAFDRDGSGGSVAFGFVIAGSQKTYLDANGLRLLNGLYVGSIGTAATDNEIYAQGAIRTGSVFYAATGINVGGATAPSAGVGIFTDSIRVGYQATGTLADTVTVGDANFGLAWNSGGAPALNFDSDTYVSYARSTDNLTFHLGGADSVRFLVTTKTFEPVTANDWDLGRSTNPWGEAFVGVFNTTNTTLYLPQSAGGIGRRVLNNTITAAATALAAGTLDTGDSRWNVVGISHSVTGTYSFTLSTALPTSQGQVIATAKTAGNIAAGYMTGPANLVIYVTNAAGTPVDDKIHFIVVGGGSHA